MSHQHHPIHTAITGHLHAHAAVAPSRRGIAPVEPPMMLTTAEAAAFAGMSLRQWHNLEAAGELPAPVWLSLRHKRYRRSDLLAWAESLVAGTAASQPAQLLAGKLAKRAKNVDSGVDGAADFRAPEAEGEAGRGVEIPAVHSNHEADPGTQRRGPVVSRREQVRERLLREADERLERLV